MKADSFEHIKNRMIKSAASIWGVKANEIESSFDPLISLLISACASEILKIENNLNESHTRVTEKLVQLMTPQATVGVKPAHAILYTDTIDAMTVVKPEYMFLHKKKVIKKNTHLNYSNIFFSSAQNFKTIKAKVNYLATGNYFAELDADNMLQPFRISQGALKPSTLHIGIVTDSDTITLDDVSLFFEISDMDNADLFYHYLKYAKCYINGRAINTLSGYYNSDTITTNNIKDVFKATSGKSHNIKNQTLRFYEKHYKTIKSEVVLAPHKADDNSAINTFITANDLEVNENTHWITIEFPSVISNTTLKHVFCTLNALPVLNRQLKTFTYQLRDYVNVIPIKTEHFFLDIHSVTNTSGKHYMPKRKNSNSLTKGSYVLRGSHLAKLDQQTAREYLVKLTEMLKDESSSFSFLNNDFLRSNLKLLNQQVSLLYEKVGQSKMESSDTTYLELEPYRKGDTLIVEYWSSFGEEANAIKSGTAVDVYDAIGLKQGSGYLVTTTFDGKNNQNMTERLNAYRRSLLSRDKIVTKEDVRALCFEIFNDKISDVKIVKSYTTGIAQHKGLTQCIEIALEVPNKKTIQTDEWKSLENNLLLQLEKKSTNIFPYKIKIVN